jgi:hypothetical protein
MDIKLINNYLINTINTIVDEDNILYQYITLNYLHFTILSTIVISNKENLKINNINKISTIISGNISKYKIEDSFAFNLLKAISIDNNLYNYINSLFTYLYGYINEYGQKISPLIIINEAMKLLKTKPLLNTNYIK